MQMSKVVPVDDGRTAEIYINKLDVLVDEYSHTLEDEDICQPQIFMGLLKHLYINAFRPDRKMVYNSTSNVINEPAEVISALWDWFCGLCYRCKNSPTLLKFSTLTGIDRSVFTDWKSGKTRGATNEYSLTAQKMYNESQMALEGKVIEQNSVGGIFALKSCFQWRETAPVLPEYDKVEHHASVEEIKARHANATLPEPVDFTDMDFDDED